MEATHISAFVQSIQNVFATMLQLQVSMGEPHVKADSATSFDVSGIIGMSGDIIGSVVLSFPTETAERVVALFTGEEAKVGDEDFGDAIGELVNMVSGGAKGMIEGKKISISCPTVVIGANHLVTRPKGMPCIAIPCETDCGEFVIEVSMQAAKKTEEASSSVATAN